MMQISINYPRYLNLSILIHETSLRCNNNNNDGLQKQVGSLCTIVSMRHIRTSAHAVQITCRGAPCHAHKYSKTNTMTPTFGTVSFTLFAFLHLVSMRMSDDNFLVGFGTNQSAGHIHSQVVIYRQGDKVFKGQLCSSKRKENEMCMIK